MSCSFQITITFLRIKFIVKKYFYQVSLKIRGINHFNDDVGINKIQPNLGLTKYSKYHDIFSQPVITLNSSLKLFSDLPVT